MSAIGAVFYAETVLSLTPILIKLVPTTLSTQTLSRFLIYPLAAIIVGGLAPLRDVIGGDIFKSLGAGTINVAHVATSYIAFKELPAGIAMSLFYTYPLWNLLGAALFFGESFPLTLLPVVGVALIGAFLVASQAREGGGEIKWRGIAAGLAAALTETGLFLIVRGTAMPTPFHNIHQFYLGGLPFLLAYLLFAGTKDKNLIDFNWRNWIPLIAFNGLLGFTGYAARFWSINRLPTIVYTVLSMFGVLASFFWGATIIGESVSSRSLVGAALLTGAIGYIRWITG